MTGTDSRSNLRSRDFCLLHGDRKLPSTGRGPDLKLFRGGRATDPPKRTGWAGRFKELDPSTGLRFHDEGADCSICGPSRSLCGSTHLGLRLCPKTGELVWVASGGRAAPLRELEADHLTNIIRRLAMNRFALGRRNLPHLVEEAKRRGMSLPLDEWDRREAS